MAIIMMAKASQMVSHPMGDGGISMISIADGTNSLCSAFFL